MHPRCGIIQTEHMTHMPAYHDHVKNLLWLADRHKSNFASSVATCVKSVTFVHMYVMRRECVRWNVLVKRDEREKRLVAQLSS